MLSIVSLKKEIGHIIWLLFMIFALIKPLEMLAMDMTSFKNFWLANLVVILFLNVLFHWPNIIIICSSKQEIEQFHQKLVGTFWF